MTSREGPMTSRDRGDEGYDVEDWEEEEGEVNAGGDGRGEGHGNKPAGEQDNTQQG